MTWVLTTYQFFYLSLSLQSFAPTSVPLPSIFRKLAGMTLPPTLTLTVPQQRNYSSLSLSSAVALFISLALNAAKSSFLFGRIKRHLKAWWSAEVESAISERRKAFAAAHGSDEDRQAYISASRRASSVIAKAKAETWQTTCSSLLAKSVHSLLRSLLPPLFFSQGIGFGICRLPEIPLFHFSAKGYLSELRRATCPVESHSSFCFPFILAKFHAAAFNLTSSTATGPDKVACPML